MARKAREKRLFCTYLIEQRGPENQKIFSNESDKQMFLGILKKTKEKYNFKLFGYCIEDNAFKLMLYDNGNDISKIMRSINISFAMKYKCIYEDCGNLFKERFKSIIVEGREEFLRITGRIHDEIAVIKVTEDSFGKYCDYINERYNSLDDMVKGSKGIDISEEIFGAHFINYQKDDEIASEDLCLECINEAKKRLDKRLDEMNISFDDMIRDKGVRNQLICEFRKNSTIKLKELGALFGGLSESAVCKILNK